ncbi:hypothetical protein FH972_022989 [Carpinus fangiana]|uniref:Uncharacterized protein n=1 Tax=Carpinus fangiana TaxID=176857 RepID=A0A5N6KTV2_9ROSI|nr:hypothetical protein FH972_022989 [Carpinus fangiana]
MALRYGLSSFRLGWPTLKFCNVGDNSCTQWTPKNLTDYLSVVLPRQQWQKLPSLFCCGKDYSPASLGLLTVSQSFSATPRYGQRNLRMRLSAVNHIMSHTISLAVLLTGDDVGDRPVKRGYVLGVHKPCQEKRRHTLNVHSNAIDPAIWYSTFAQVVLNGGSSATDQGCMGQCGCV